jgi:hypothetical protein
MAIQLGHFGGLIEGVFPRYVWYWDGYRMLALLDVDLDSPCYKHLGCGTSPAGREHRLKSLERLKPGEAERPGTRTERQIARMQGAEVTESGNRAANRGFKGGAKNRPAAAGNLILPFPGP